MMIHTRPGRAAGSGLIKGRSWVLKLAPKIGKRQMTEGPTVPKVQLEERPRVGGPNGPGPMVHGPN